LIGVRTIVASHNPFAAAIPEEKGLDLDMGERATAGTEL
jgi:hypothetical protein